MHFAWIGLAPSAGRSSAVVRFHGLSTRAAPLHPCTLTGIRPPPPAIEVPRRTSTPMRPPYVAGFTALLVLTLAVPARAVTPNGRLQIIQLDVGQGDGALLISPLGQTVLIDEGPSGVTPAMGVSVLNQLRA